MNTVIDRNWEQQEKFAKDLFEFENNMRTCSRELRGQVEDARDNIQADNARAALDYLIQLLDQIDSSLPGISEFGTRQLYLAKHIRDAESVKFTRR